MFRGGSHEPAHHYQHQTNVCNLRRMVRKPHLNTINKAQPNTLYYPISNIARNLMKFPSKNIIDHNKSNVIFDRPYNQCPDCIVVMVQRSSIWYVWVMMKIKIKLFNKSWWWSTWESCNLKRDTAIRTKLWEYKELAG